MTRDEVFAKLAAEGITDVKVRFSGGGDDGGVESITCNRGDEKVLIDDPALEEALGEPVYEKYGSFAGEFYVDGDVIWDVATRKVTMKGSERVETWEDRSEEL